MIVVGSNYPLRIGVPSRHNYIMKMGEEIEVVLVPLREATYEEWKEYRERSGRPLNLRAEDAYFYLASID